GCRAHPRRHRHRPRRSSTDQPHPRGPAMNQHDPATLHDDLAATTAHLRHRLAGVVPTVGLVLGSGLGAFADELTSAVAVPYGEIPGFPSSTVAGHAGRLVVGGRGGVTCAAMQGRVHYYEGHPARVVAYPVRALVAL